MLEQRQTHGISMYPQWNRHREIGHILFMCNNLFRLWLCKTDDCKLTSCCFLFYWPESRVKNNLSNLCRHFFCRQIRTRNLLIGRGTSLQQRRWGSSCGRVISVLAFYSDNRGLNHAEVYNFL